MGPKIEINDIESGKANLSIQGFFDEKLKFPADYNFEGLQHLVIDFELMEGINSFGVKTWIRFMERLQKIDQLKVTFEKCNRMVIDQMIKIEGFIPKSVSVISFNAPIYCGVCDQSFSVNRKVEQAPENIDEILEAVDPEACTNYPTCKKKWEVDLTEDEYNRFLKIIKTS